MKVTCLFLTSGQLLPQKTWTYFKKFLYKGCEEIPVFFFSWYPNQVKYCYQFVVPTLTYSPLFSYCTCSWFSEMETLRGVKYTQHWKMLKWVFPVYAISSSNTNQGYRDLLLSLLQGHLRDVACNLQSSSYHINLAKCSSRRVTWLPVDTWPLSNPIIVNYAKKKPHTP